jgi:hypothetical protein
MGLKDRSGRNKTFLLRVHGAVKTSKTSAEKLQSKESGIHTETLDSSLLECDVIQSNVPVYNLPPQSPVFKSEEESIVLPRNASNIFPV